MLTNRLGPGAARSPEALTYGEVIQMLKAAHKRRTANTRWLDAADWPALLSLKQLKGMQAIPRHADRALRRKASPNLAPDEYETLAQRGQKAVDELRRVLPRFIQLKEELAEKGPNSLLYLMADWIDEMAFTKKWISDERELRRAYALMLTCLLDFEHRDASKARGQYRREAKSWHQDALMIFNDFINIMGAGSISQNGPAVHFVRAVLAWAGVSVEHLAIEQALRRGGAQAVAKPLRNARIGKA